MYGNPYSKFATLHGMIEAYDFVHQWTSDGGQLTSSDVRLMIDGMTRLRYTSLFALCAEEVKHKGFKPGKISSVPIPF